MHLECDFVELFLRGQCYYKKSSYCVYFFLVFWTDEPCNELLRTKRSDFREKILKEGVKKHFYVNHYGNTSIWK